MDKQFLEFWGNLMLAAARGQATTDAFSSWLTRGAGGSEDISAMFGKFYGLGQPAAGGSATWESARAAFDDAFRSYLDVLQAVPRSQYETLQRRVEALEEKTAAQEALIGNLRRQLSESHAARGDVARGLEELVQIQGTEFKKLTDSVGRFFGGKREKE